MNAEDREEDYRLAQAALAREPGAVHAFAERMVCIPKMLQARSARHGRRLSADDIDDLSQEVFEVVWKKLATFRGDCPLEGWVYQFCARLLLRFSRRSGVQAVPSAELERASSAEVDVPGQHLDRALLLASLDRIPENESRVVFLKHFRGLNLPEVAGELGVPLNTAKTRYYRGLDRLRVLLRPLAPEVD